MLIILELGIWNLQSDLLTSDVPSPASPALIRTLAGGVCRMGTGLRSGVRSQPAPPGGSPASPASTPATPSRGRSRPGWLGSAPAGRRPQDRGPGQARGQTHHPI